MPDLIAYHNDPAIKAKYIARFAAHRAADEVVQGIGYIDGRGCFVGCTLNAYNHNRFEVELGWPQWLASLADTIFEGLPAEEAPQFGTNILEAVPVGANLEPVRARFLFTIQRRILESLAGEPEHYVSRSRQKFDRLAASSVASAAMWAAWRAATSLLAKTAEYQAQRDDLLALLRECAP